MTTQTRFRILFRRERIGNLDIIEYLSESGGWVSDHNDAAKLDVEAAMEKHARLSEYYTMGWMVFTPGGDK